MKNALRLVCFILATGCTVATNDNFQNPPPPPPSTCNQQTFTWCGAGSVGYSCTSDRPDDGDTNYVCSAGQAGPGETLFCCLPFAQYFNECTVDTAIPGCADPGFGFSCAGMVGPADVDSTLACSAPSPTSGGEAYCCVPAATTPTCTPYPAASCVGAATGFMCLGDDSPGVNDATIACDVGVAGEAGSTVHCCVPFLQSGAGCQERQDVGCIAGSFGFSCQGAQRPETFNAVLSCESAPSGASTYCCSLGE